jgi:uncharacterized protein YjbI with pentapeptide repeats
VLVRIRLLTRFAAQGLAEIPEMLQTQAVMRPHLKETFMPRIRRVSVASLAMLLLLLAPIQTVAAGSSQRCAAPPGPGVDLHGCDLSGATLRIDLQGINLARADLRGVIAGCDPDLRSANLTGAILYGADLRDGLWCDVSFAQADLHNADLRNASFEDATFTGANLASARLDLARAAFVNFLGARMANVSFRDGDSVGSYLKDADLHGADLRGTSFASARFLGTNLRGARLDEVDLSRADLTGADLRNAKGLSSVIWSDTTCVDGTNSDTNGGTCVGHLG